MYLFPRDCRRVLSGLHRLQLRKTISDGRVADRAGWSHPQNGRGSTNLILHRYEFLEADFMSHHAGMWVGLPDARHPDPSRDVKRDLLVELRGQDVELRVMDSSVSLQEPSKTSLHVSGLRLRNARDSKNSQRGGGWMSTPRELGHYPHCALC